VRRNRTASVAAVLAAATLVASACSSPQGTEQPENSLLGKGKKDGRAGDGDRGRGSGKASGGKTKAGRPEVAGGEVSLPSAAPGETPPPSGAAKTETKVSSTGTDPRSASVLVTEPDPDAERSGLVPDYSEIVSVRIEGRAADFRVTITFRGPVPEKMPDDKTYMIAGMGVTEREKDEGYAFGASADAKGWTPYAGNKEEAEEFPGTMSIDDATIVFTMPWSAMGGPQPFKWYSQASWFRSLAGTTHYSLDIVPNEGPARFPAG
jgi:hypothetical protein